jgi:hypothetical protein
VREPAAAARACIGAAQTYVAEAKAAAMRGETLPTIDLYSVSAVPIELFFEATLLGVATAFIWAEGAAHFLITNWHNVSGKDPFTGKHISTSLAEPNSVRVWFNPKERLGHKAPTVLPLLDATGQSLWWEHPEHGEKVDVVALPLGPQVGAEIYPINQLEAAPLQLQIGMDVFVIGYPLGVAPLPVWKRGSIATEPEVLVPNLYMLVDTASRPGMSGSPVIRRSWATHMMEIGPMKSGVEVMTRFVGVYSGRLTSTDPLDAQLGLCWPAKYVTEIIAGRHTQR